MVEHIIFLMLMKYLLKHFSKYLGNSMINMLVKCKEFNKLQQLHACYEFD